MFPARPYLPAVGAACSSAHRARSPSRKMPLAVMLPEPVARAEPGSNLKFLPGSPGLGMGGSSSQVTCRNLPRFTVILFSKEPLQLPFSTHNQGRSRIQSRLHTAGRTAQGRGEGKGEPRLQGGRFFTADLDGNPYHLAEGCDRPLCHCCPAALGTNHPPRAPAGRTLPMPPCDAGQEKEGDPHPLPIGSVPAGPFGQVPTPGDQDPSDGAGPATSAASARASPTSPRAFWEVREGAGLQCRCFVKWDLQRQSELAAGKESASPEAAPSRRAPSATVPREHSTGCTGPVPSLW